MLTDPAITALAPDPANRSCILNGNAFQQDAIQSFGGWQYACYYASPSLSPASTEPLYVHLARRKLPGGSWETMIFDDYAQTTDDGHNTVQIASQPDKFEWDKQHFSPTVDALPGLPYDGDLLGTGKAGLGDDHMCVYGADTGTYSYTGMNLKGIQSCPYIHGLDYRNSRLYVTWVYRGFVWYEGWDDPLDTKHKQQRGPNEGTNNHNICFAYSEDDGATWKNSASEQVADLSRGQSITPESPGIVAFEIPKGSGLSNQESQAVDHNGGVHVLNRDKMSGEQKWKHYYRSSDGKWTQRALPYVKGVYGGKRGRFAISKTGDLFLILPDNEAPTLTILKASNAGGYTSYDLVWKGDGFPPTEPLVDVTRLDQDNVLSVLTRQDVRKASEGRNVVVVDFNLKNQ
ncbi:hypothetical protein SCUP234_07193 [Seiridium cupressi]